MERGGSSSATMRSPFATLEALHRQGTGLRTPRAPCAPLVPPGPLRRQSEGARAAMQPAAAAAVPLHGNARATRASSPLRRRLACAIAAARGTEASHAASAGWRGVAGGLWAYLRGRSAPARPL
eukprot:scaffold2910_cov390-Prasinococcus_capsulatus_cf.AAC.19